MTNKQIIIDGVDVSGCAWCICETDTDPYCKINNGEDLGCEDNPNCYYKQLQREKQSSQEAIDTSIREFNRAEELKTLLKRKEQKLERITNMLFTGQCSNCEGYSPNCSNKELCNFKHNIKNIIDEVENAK